jgi:hypothetical protein
MKKYICFPFCYVTFPLENPAAKNIATDSAKASEFNSNGANAAKAGPSTNAVTSQAQNSPGS